MNSFYKSTTSHLPPFRGRGEARRPSNGAQEGKRCAVETDFSMTGIKEARLTWNFLRDSLKDDEDRAVLTRCKSPRYVSWYLEQFYDPESQVALNKLCEKFHDFTTQNTTARQPHSCINTRPQYYQVEWKSGTWAESLMPRYMLELSPPCLMGMHTSRRPCRR